MFSIPISVCSLLLWGWEELAFPLPLMGRVISLLWLLCFAAIASGRAESMRHCSLITPHPWVHMLFHILGPHGNSLKWRLSSSYSADEKKTLEEKLQLVAKMKLNPRRLALNSEFLPQYPIHVRCLANEELAPHPEESTCSKVCPMCLSQPPATWKPLDAL